MIERRTFLQTAAASAVTLALTPDVLAVTRKSPSSTNPGVPGLAGAGEFFYRPANAWAGDFIPFVENGVFHLFYIHDRREQAGDHSSHSRGLPWFKVSTKDFVHFTEHGEAIPAGSVDEQDYIVCTGSVIRAEGLYHIFYTGCNRSFRAQGKRGQAVMHAVSRDLVKWAKIPEDTFYSPIEGYEPHDWRDPFVFWNEEAGEYWMLLAARLKKSGSRRRSGVVALCASKDLKRWEVRDPFWAPGLYFTHECPDLFRMGDWWYLVYSEFTEQYRTRYRMSRSLAGPWLAPQDDCFDGRAFYAAKTAAHGGHRYLFGWLPTKTDDKDDNAFDWGGNLVVHELKQQQDGTLSVGVPTSIDAAFTKSIPVQFSLREGEATIAQDQVALSAPDSFACTAAGTMPKHCKIETQLQFDPGTRGCGIMLRTSDDLDTSYYVRVEPQQRRVVLDSWPPARVIYENTPVSTNGGFMVGLERSVNVQPNVPVELKILVDGSCAVIYIDGKVALSTRMYDLPNGRWGVFVNQGSARFRNFKFTEL